MTTKIKYTDEPIGEIKIVKVRGFGVKRIWGQVLKYNFLAL